MNNYMYILECSDGSLYTGWTNNLEKRIKVHNTGRGAKYTRNRRPVRLCYWEMFATKEEAMSREFWVKRMVRAEKLDLIKNGGLMKNSLRIRPLDERDDAMALSRVYEESWKEAYRNIVPQAYLDSIPAGSWCGMVNQSGMNTLVVTAGEEIVGTSSYCERRPFDVRFDKSFFSDRKTVKKDERTKDWGEIVSIYFLPQYMGKGHGMLLMQAVLGELRKTGYQNCCLWVLEENERARHFYEKIGFVPDGAYMEQEIGGELLREIRYVLSL